VSDALSSPEQTEPGPESRRRRKWSAALVTIVIGAVLVAVLPSVASDYVVGIADLTLLAMLGALGLNLVMGVAGQISLANAGFLAIGGYFAATASADWRLPFLLVLLLSGCAGAVVGAILSIPTIRIRGIYLVIATISFLYIVFYFGQRYQTARVGTSGFVLPAPSLGSQQLSSYRAWYLLLAVIAALTWVLLRNLLRTPYGRAWRLLRVSETAASILGIEVARLKLTAFAVSSFIITLEGALLAYFNGVVSSDTFTLALSVQYVAMVIVGGLGSFEGALLGSIFISVLPFVTQNLLPHVPKTWLDKLNLTQDQVPNVNLFLFGLAIVVFMIFEPGGLVRLLSRVLGGIQRLFMWAFGPAQRRQQCGIRCRLLPARRTGSDDQSR
jgi:branched-chain amino acid transport system permease protein